MCCADQVGLIRNCEADLILPFENRLLDSRCCRLEELRFLSDLAQVGSNSLQVRKELTEELSLAASRKVL